MASKVSLARRRRRAQRHSSRLVGSLATLCALAMGAWRRVLCSGALEPRVATVLAVLTCVLACAQVLPHVASTSTSLSTVTQPPSLQHHVRAPRLLMRLDDDTLTAVLQRLGPKELASLGGTCKSMIVCVGAHASFRSFEGVLGDGHRVAHGLRMAAFRHRWITYATLERLMAPHGAALSAALRRAD